MYLENAGLEVFVLQDGPELFLHEGVAPSRPEHVLGQLHRRQAPPERVRPVLDVQ